MDLKVLMSTLLSDESICNVGQKTGASAAEVKSVLGSALPLLLNGANAQATDASTAESFAGALLQHSQNDTSNLAAFLGNVDMDDGAKIVAHLLGANNSTGTESVARQTGVSTAKTGSILSTAAPLLMSLIGQQTNTESSGSSGIASLMGNLLGSADMSSLLSGLMGGSTTAAEETAPKETAKTIGLLGKLFGLLK